MREWEQRKGVLGCWWREWEKGGCREWRRGGRGCGGGDGSGVVAVVEGIEEGGVGVLGERLGEGVCGGKG